MYACVHAHVGMCEGQGWFWDVFLYCYPLYCLKLGLLLNLSFAILARPADWLASKATGSSCLYPLAPGLPHPDFYAVIRESNSVPQAYVLIASPTEPSPNLRLFINTPFKGTFSHSWLSHPKQVRKKGRTKEKSFTLQPTKTMLIICVIHSKTFSIILVHFIFFSKCRS